MTEPAEQPTGFVYVDCETTGLDRRRHHVFELAWALDDGPIYTLLLPHTLRYAQPEALAVGRYHERRIADMIATRDWYSPPRTTITDFVTAFAGPDGSRRTLVAANPAFDAGMLHGKVIGREPWTSRTRRLLHLPAPDAPAEPWHHRLLDIEAYAAGAFGWPHLAGLRTISDWLTEHGYPIPAPDHTAASDVATLRAIHRAVHTHITGRTPAAATEPTRGDAR